MSKSNGFLKTSLLLLPILAALFLTLLPTPAFAKTLFIGDSRTVGMYNAVAGFTYDAYIIDTDNTDNWYAYGGMGYDWFETDAVPFADETLEDGDDVVILMGCNDLLSDREYDYAYLLNIKADEWLQRDITTFFVSVNPIDDYLSEVNGYYLYDCMVQDFNQTLSSQLSDKVHWVDSYSVLQEEGFETFDGIHYEYSTGEGIYNICKEAINIEEREDSMPVALSGMEDIEIQETTIAETSNEDDQLEQIASSPRNIYNMYAVDWAKARLAYKNNEDNQAENIFAVVMSVATIIICCVALAVSSSIKRKSYNR